MSWKRVLISRVEMGWDGYCLRLRDQTLLKGAVVVVLWITIENSLGSNAWRRTGRFQAWKFKAIFAQKKERKKFRQVRRTT